MVKGEGEGGMGSLGGRYARLKWLVSDSPIWDSLIFAKEFLGVFHEADDDDDGGAGHANKEHDLQDVHGE